MAKQTSGYINRKKIANSGTHNLFYELFEPINEPPKATLLILHGMQEHSGRYKNLRNIWRRTVLQFYYMTISDTEKRRKIGKNLAIFKRKSQAATDRRCRNDGSIFRKQLP
jgi:hypothetical protein